MSHTPESPSAKRRFTRRQQLLFIGLGALALIVVLALAGLLYLRSGRFNRYLAGEIEAAMKDYGMRAEVGGFELAWGLRTATLRDLKLYNQQTGQLIATLDRATLTAEVREPYAFRFSREIVLHELKLDGFQLWVELDPQGRSNFEGLRNPPPGAPRRITFDYASLVGAISRGIAHVNDRAHQVQGELRELRGNARPLKGTNPAAVRVEMTSGAGRVSYEGRESSVNGIEFLGRVMESGAEIERFALHSAMTEATASGRLDDWRALRYKLDTHVVAKLNETAQLFIPQTPLQGQADFTGRVEGEGARYQINGRLSADELAAMDTRLRGVLAEGIQVGPEGERLNFAVQHLRAQSIAAKGVTLNNATIPGLRGEVRDGRAQLTAPQVSIAHLAATQGGTKSEATGITLQSLNAVIGAGQSEVRGDLKLARGSFGEAQLGPTHGHLVANQTSLSLNKFEAALLGGNVTGDAAVQIKGNGASRLQARFAGLKTGEVFALVATGNAPLSGTVDGQADVSWPGTNVRRLSGTVTTHFTGQTTTTLDAIPVTGDVAVKAQDGLFNFDQLALNTAASTLTATGSLALNGDSNLRFTLSSTRAEELQTIAYSLGPVPQAISDNEPQLNGNFKFEGTLTGPLNDPTLTGDVQASSFGLHDTMLGSLSGHVLFSPTEIRFENGALAATNGGSAKLTYLGPRDETAATGRLDATLDRLNVDDLVAASGFSIPQKFITGEISGTAHLTGLPASPLGQVSVNLVSGTVAGQPAQLATASVVFDTQTARLEAVEARLPQGHLTASGNLNLKSKEFQAQGKADQVDLGRLAETLELTNVQFTGTADATFQASGNASDLSQLQLHLAAQGRQVTINGRDAGELRVTAQTSPGGRVDLEMVTGIIGKPQSLTASIELRQPGTPIEVKTDLTNFDLTPIVAIFAPNLSSSVMGTVSGTLRVAGPLMNAQDELTLDRLHGNLSLTTVALQVAGTPITIATPVNVALNGPEISIASTRINGPNTDLRFGGTLGWREGAGMNFALNGTVNLQTLNSLTQDVFVGGTMTIDARINGTASQPVLSGEARLDKVSFSSLDVPVAVENGTGRFVLAGQQITLESFTARANDGTMQANGSMTLAQLRPSQWQFKINANDVEVFYQGVRATANTSLTLAGTPENQTLVGTVTIPLAEYTSNFDFDSLSSNRGGFDLSSLGGAGATGSSTGPFSLPPVYLGIHVEAHDSFLIRNEQVNTVASAALDLGGTLSAPEITGRTTLEGGTIKFRGQRYQVTSGTLDLLGGFGVEPEMNLLAEGDVSGYHVYVGFLGPLNDLEVTLRAEPDLARAEILSLITTGRTESGTLNSQDLMRSGVGTAASLLSEQFLSQPLRQETERLLGINRFQIDPVLRPNANPAARLTIGRQIARNLSFTYSTNFATEQDQTAIVEYNLTNRFSAIASYTQGGSSTQQGTNDNDFTIEVRGRQRFSLGAGRSNTMASVGPNAGGTGRDVSAPSLPERTPRLSATVDLNKPQAIKISEKQLRDLLPVKREGFSYSLMRLGERNLTNYLQEKGYFFAEVHARCEPTDCSGPNLRLLYDVSPGEHYHLHEIRITGTDELHKSDVIDNLQSQESSLLGAVPFVAQLPLIGGSARGITSNDRLRNDRETIRRRLADLGFRSARVSARRAVQPESLNLIIIFEVEEGPRSYITEVDLQGNTALTTDELRKVVPIKDGEAFSLTNARTGAQKIKDYYAQHGYLEAKPALNIVDLPENRVRLVYEVTEGAQAIAQEVSITGQAISRAAAIHRFIDFNPGTVITPQLLRRTQRDLYATGAFREVNIHTDAISQDDPSARRVTVNVTEAKPLLLVYGLGYSTDDGPRGLIQLTHTNLFGHVNSASLKLRASRREQLGQFQFTDLRPFGYKWPMTFSVFYDRNSDLRPFVRQRLVGGQVEPSTPGRSFGINRFAAFIQSEHKRSEVTSVRVRYSFENAKLFNLQNIPEIEVTRNERAIRLGMFSVGISRDTRDSALNPTRGQLLSADHSIAARIFGGNESFNKFFGNYQRYHTLPTKFPVLHNSVIAVSARLGLAQTFKATDRDGDGIITEPERRLPISERFFAGGATTLRGFRFEEAGPQGVLEPRQPNELPTLVPLGGDALAVFNFELRYPLTRRLRLVPFYDLGNVFRRVSDISFGRMTNTFGVGLRINTPLGPIGVDYGFLLDPPSFLTASGAILRQPRGVIHIRFGQTF